MAPFVPRDFQVPATLETSEFRLRMLTIHDVVKDFDAVITSVDHLKIAFPCRSIDWDAWSKIPD
jgi:hypothetical protein